MKALLLASLISISVSVWSYTKLQSHTGYGNTGATLKGTVIVFIITFVVVLTIGLALFH